MIEYTVKVNEYGTTMWYLNGKLHREDGPAIEYRNGDKSWYLNDKLHREDGPAVEYATGGKKWVRNDKLHREDGPAIMWSDGSIEWWLNNDFYSSEERWKAAKNPVVELTVAEISEKLGATVKVVE